MTSDAFRKLALTLPDAEERAHMHHPDFRVNNRIFATLGYPGDGWAMVVLTPEDQAAFVSAKPGVFVPGKGKWGQQGCTLIELRSATASFVREALRAAYEAKANLPVRSKRSSRTKERKSARRID